MAEGGGNNPFGIVGYQKAVPSADDLLSLKLLAETDQDFDYLKDEAVLYLKNAMRMLASSPFLRTKFGGDGIKPASVLAELLKQRADTLNFQLHIDDMARQLLNKEFSKINMTGLRPKVVPVYGNNGGELARPVNLLGMRQPFDTSVNPVTGQPRGFINNAAMRGGIDINAFGNRWNTDQVLTAENKRAANEFAGVGAFRNSWDYLYG